MKPMASQKQPARKSVSISTVSVKEIALILLVMVVLAGTAASVTLLA
jgi:hypothetical protein